MTAADFAPLITLFWLPFAVIAAGGCYLLYRCLTPFLSRRKRP